MAQTVCYLKLNRSIAVNSEDVWLKDAAGIFCEDTTVEAKIKSIKVYHFTDREVSGGKTSATKSPSAKSDFRRGRCVISVLKIIELISQAVPEISVESIGETEVIVEFSEKCQGNRGRGALVAKVVLVSLISFFGTAFTIMAYHNDIGIVDVFSQIHRLVMGRENTGISVLEISYSIGLSLGIILFFNHVGHRKITKDPTPIEVEMRKYETDVDITLVEAAEREGQIIDV